MKPSPSPSLPPLDEIAASVPGDQIPVLVTALMMRLLAEPPVVVANDHGGNGKVPDETLTAEQIGKALDHSTRWVYRSARRLPFVKRVGRSLVCSRRDLEAWREKQKVK